MIKRIFSVVIVFMMCALIMPVNVFASGQGCYIYYIDESEFVNNNGSAEGYIGVFFANKAQYPIGLETPRGDTTLNLEHTINQAYNTGHFFFNGFNFPSFSTGNYTLKSFPIPDGYELVNVFNSKSAMLVGNALSDDLEKRKVTFQVQDNDTFDLQYDLDTVAIFVIIRKVGSAPANPTSVPSIPTDPTPAPSIPTDPANLVAIPTSSSVLVNGNDIAFDAYNIKGNNYFKLRDLAYSLNSTVKQFEVMWDASANMIQINSGKPYVTAGGEMTGKGTGEKAVTPTSSKIKVNGNDVSFECYNIEGNNYFKLRDIGEVLNFGVNWDGINNMVLIETDKEYIMQ